MAFINGTVASESLSSIGFSGGFEADWIFGAAGSDILHSFYNNDILDGGDGNDQLFAGSGNDSLEGGSGDDFLFEGSGNDWSNGGQGNDSINSDLGDDTLIGGSGIDTISFIFIDVTGAGGEINDYVPINIDLNKSVQDFGVLGLDRYYGFENVGGSATNDRILGSAGANSLMGETGNDIVDGRAGNDLVQGGFGSDLLIGGAGADIIHTAFGFTIDSVRDRIDYNALSESGVALSARDLIFGFDPGGKATDDKIDLSTIDANPFLAGNQSFKFVNAFSAHVGEVRVVAMGGDTIVLVDADKDLSAEMAITIENATGLKAFDFMLLNRRYDCSSMNSISTRVMRC